MLRGERPNAGAGRLTVPLMVPGRRRNRHRGLCFGDRNRAGRARIGDHTGYYNSVEQFPVLRITAITMRRDPIYLSTFTGRPPDEPSVIGEAS